MFKNLIAVALVLTSTMATAHELIPTYPEFKSSYVDGIAVTTLKLWNRRNDVSYYELQVFDREWNPIDFASQSRLIKIGYLEHKRIDVYVKENDLSKIEFICTTSKLLKEDVDSTGITSKICSRVK